MVRLNGHPTRGGASRLLTLGRFGDLIVINKRKLRALVSKSTRDYYRVGKPVLIAVNHLKMISQCAPALGNNSSRLLEEKRQFVP